MGRVRVCVCVWTRLCPVLPPPSTRISRPLEVYREGGGDGGREAMDSRYWGMASGGGGGKVL